MGGGGGGEESMEREVEGGDFGNGDNGGVSMLVRARLPSPYDRSSSTSLSLEMLGVQ